MLVAAILADDRFLYDIAANNKKITQSKLYELFLSKYSTREHEDLIWALNLYARNERVRTHSINRKKYEKPRLIIHIGATKTGSTCIQHVLDENRPRLLKEGILYPEVGLFWQEKRPHKQAGHTHFAPAANQKKLELLKHVEASLSLMEGKIHTNY